MQQCNHGGDVALPRYQGLGEVAASSGPELFGSDYSPSKSPTLHLQASAIFFSVESRTSGDLPFSRLQIVPRLIPIFSANVD